MPVWRPLAGLIRSLSTRVGCDPSQSCRPRFSSPDRLPECPPTQGWRSIGMVADQLDYVVGVDPHRDEHALGVVEVRSGVVVFETSVAADSDGYANALAVAQAACAGSACVRGRGHRLLRGWADALPGWQRRAGVRGRSSRAASAAGVARPTRSTLSGPPARVLARAARDATHQRRTGGAAGADGRS